MKGGTEEQWLDSFMAIYKQVSPLIDRVTKFNTEGGPADPGSLLEAYQSFSPLLQSLKEMPNPAQRELRKIKNDFEKTLSMCAKAGEMAIKMSDDLKHNAKLAARMHVSSVVGYISYAEIYHKALLGKLAKLGQTGSKD